MDYYIFIFVLALIIELIKALFGNKKNHNSSYHFNNSFFSQSINTAKNKSAPPNKLSWKEKQFEKEADLWGLSSEDRRLAKEERMSPADFIEAEERNDDELDTDEWE